MIRTINQESPRGREGRIRHELVSRGLQGFELAAFWAPRHASLQRRVWPRQATGVRRDQRVGAEPVTRVTVDLAHKHVSFPSVGKRRRALAPGMVAVERLLIEAPDLWVVPEAKLC